MDNTSQPAPVRRRFAGNLSLRTKLIIANLTIVTAAVVALGIYSNYREGQTTSFLSTELDTTVSAQAQDTLNARIDQEALNADNYFTAITRDLVALKSNIDQLLLNQSILETGEYWDAETQLTRLPSGHWDNANDQPAAVFVSGSLTPADALRSELNAMIHLDFAAPGILEANPNIVALYFIGTSGETIYYPNIDLASLLPADFDATTGPWYVAASPANNPTQKAVWTVPYQDPALTGLLVTNSLPIYDRTGRFVGVVSLDVQLSKISELVSSIHVGETGYAFLIDDKSHVIAMPKVGYKDLKLTPENVPVGEPLRQTLFGQAPASLTATLTAMTAGQPGFQTVVINGTERYVAFQPIPSLNYSLAIIVPVSEMRSTFIAARERLAEETRQTATNILVIIGIILAVSLLASFGIGNALTSPLAQLTQTATEIAQGNLNAQARVQTRDELGTLASTLNTMTATLRGLIGSLEQRVEERTRDLATTSTKMEYRARQLETIAEIARVVTSVQDVDQLLPKIVATISERFDFYHSGIFLLDESGHHAELRAANSEGGQRMLNRRHTLAVEETSIVGYVTKVGEARVAMDVGVDAVHFQNPDLPDTRSELALPLRVGKNIIGALDVQSKTVNAFTADDIQLLGILADQVAIAIENARLFSSARRALDESQGVYQQYVKQEWGKFTAQAKHIGFRFSESSTDPLSGILDHPEMEAATSSGEIVKMKTIVEKGAAATTILAVPIKIRGEVIGVLDVRSNQPGREWSVDEVALVQALADRAALSLENARLFEEATVRADRERKVSQIADKLNSSFRIETILKTAAEELSRALQGSEVLVQIQPPVESKPAFD
jgi:GAF domain-containing protein/HAMP domain-containing protein